MFRQLSNVEIDPEMIEVQSLGEAARFIAQRPPETNHLFPANDYPRIPYIDASDDLFQIDDKGPLPRGRFDIGLRTPKREKKKDLPVFNNHERPDIYVRCYPPPDVEERSEYGVIQVERRLRGSDSNSASDFDSVWEFFTYVHAGRVEISELQSVLASANPSSSTKESGQKDFWAKYTGNDTKGRSKAAKFLSLNIAMIATRSDYVYRCRQYILNGQRSVEAVSNYSPEWTYTKQRMKLKNPPENLPQKRKHNSFAEVEESQSSAAHSLMVLADAAQNPLTLPPLNIFGGVHVSEPTPIDPMGEHDLFKTSNSKPPGKVPKSNSGGSFGSSRAGGSHSPTSPLGSFSSASHIGSFSSAASHAGSFSAASFGRSFSPTSEPDLLSQVTFRLPELPSDKKVPFEMLAFVPPVAWYPAPFSHSAEENLKHLAFASLEYGYVVRNPQTPLAGLNPQELSDGGMRKPQWGRWNQLIPRGQSFAKDLPHIVSVRLSLTRRTIRDPSTDIQLELLSYSGAALGGTAFENRTRLATSSVLPVGFSRCHQIRVEVSQATDYLNSLNQDVKLEESSYLEDELVDLEFCLRFELVQRSSKPGLEVCVVKNNGFGNICH